MKSNNQYPKSFTKAALAAFPKNKKLHRLIQAGEKNQVGILINEGLKPTYVFTADQILRALRKNDFYKLEERAILYKKRKNLLSSWAKITKNW